MTRRCLFAMIGATLAAVVTAKPSPPADDTAVVQGYFDRGEPIPHGTYRVSGIRVSSRGSDYISIPTVTITGGIAPPSRLWLNVGRGIGRHYSAPQGLYGGVA